MENDCIYCRMLPNELKIKCHTCGRGVANNEDEFLIVATDDHDGYNRREWTRNNIASAQMIADQIMRNPKLYQYKKVEVFNIYGGQSSDALYTISRG